MPFVVEQSKNQAPMIGQWAIDLDSRFGMDLNRIGFKIEYGTLQLNQVYQLGFW